MKVAVVGEAGRLMEVEGAEAEEEGGGEVREKMEAAGEGCQAAAAGYRKRMAEGAVRHMRQAIRC